MEDGGLKAVRYGDPGAERPGLLDRAGIVRDLSDVIEDWTPKRLSPESLRQIAALDPTRLTAVEKPVRLGAPVIGSRKFIGIGLNFKDFAREANRPLPAEPAVFTKAVSCIVGPGDAVILPPNSIKTDWEVELGAVIGSIARYVERQRALEYVAGYVLVNDLSEREYQNDRGGTWDKGKGCDTFGPIGPWLVTADEIPNPQDVDLWLEVNGHRYQDGCSRDMIFTVAELIAYVSAFMTLEPGDIVTTGTPAGVGMSQKPQPVFLADGDLMRLGSSKLGIQEHRVQAWRSP
jgi:2-keto-4-pentenoate hydratase/2-oxohepta-3-ene-1,7-dioic acid hydratase in catechol pathway